MCTSRAYKTTFIFFLSRKILIQILIFFIFLQDWEKLTLSKLKWDVAAVTPLDFLSHLLRRIPIESSQYQRVNSHAQTLISLWARGNLNLHSSCLGLWRVMLLCVGEMPIKRRETLVWSSRVMRRRIINEGASRSYAKCRRRASKVAYSLQRPSHDRFLRFTHSLVLCIHTDRYQKSRRFLIIFLILLVACGNNQLFRGERSRLLCVHCGVRLKRWMAL